MVKLSDLIRGDVPTALDAVALVAATRTKQADLVPPDMMTSFKSIVPDIAARSKPVLAAALGGQFGQHAGRALLGAGLGAGLSTLLDYTREKEKRRGLLRSLLEGGALGGLAGGGTSVLAPMVGQAITPMVQPLLSKLGAQKRADNMFSGLGERLSGLGSTLANAASSAWANPYGRAAIIGGGLGLAGGGVASLLDKERRKRWLSNALTTGLLGATAGGGLGLAYQHFLGGGLGPKPLAPETTTARTEAAQKAQAGHDELSRLGFPSQPINKATEQLRQGQLTPGQTTEQIMNQRPGLLEQIRGIPGGTQQAIHAGEPLNAAAHADFLGLKNVLPTSEHFDPTTLGTAAALHLGARSLNPGDPLTGGIGRQKLRSGIDWLAETGIGKRTPVPTFADVAQPPGAGNTKTFNEWWAGRNQQLINEELKNINLARTEAHKPHLLAEQAFLPEKGIGYLSRAEMDRMILANARNRQAARLAPTTTVGKMTGGVLPMLAALAPLVAHEWGGEGYRSGLHPATSVADANAVLRQ